MTTISLRPKGPHRIGGRNNDTDPLDPGNALVGSGDILGDRDSATYWHLAQGGSYQQPVLYSDALCGVPLTLDAVIDWSTLTNVVTSVRLRELDLTGDYSVVLIPNPASPDPSFAAVTIFDSTYPTLLPAASTKTTDAGGIVTGRIDYGAAGAVSPTDRGYYLENDWALRLENYDTEAPCTVEILEMEVLLTFSQTFTVPEGLAVASSGKPTPPPFSRLQAIKVV